ncbi:MAG: response regulator transcription factor [Bradyrhizobiaceae bacterium]|nr:MAG: response regulator transcription factor [Bradyrhizobiaceae bacterium]
MNEPVILVVEDDREIQTLLADFLAREGYKVLCAGDGAAMNRALEKARPDLVVLDIMLPGEDGLSICRRLRAGDSIPILMLTARAEDIDRIVGLEMGADDYLPKPFNPRELLARIRAILRRANGIPRMESARRLAFGDFIANIDARSLSDIGGKSIELTATEFDLLACFLERPKRVLSREQLLDWTRGRSADPFDRTIDVSISRLRRKLAGARPQADQIIKTVRNGGYFFAADVQPAPHSSRETG